MRSIVTQGKVLGHVASASNPNKQYEIRLGADGVVYCGCVAWKMHKWCKHLDQWHAQSAVVNTIAAEVDSPLPKQTTAMLKFFNDYNKPKPNKKPEGVTFDEIIQKGIIEGQWN